ncbi:MAG: hypothetical protein Q4G60_15280 [bacterium]|nr:hypothetical protein [bacterium]
MGNETLTKLSPPWYVYHRKVQALFGRDPEVHIKDLADLGDGKFSYMILVYNQEKADAIKAILPQKVERGNITIDVTILGPGEDDIKPDVKPDREATIEDIHAAFTGNPVFERTITRTLGMYVISYCVFKKEVIQFWNDDLSDYFGNYNGLASDIAKEILKPTAVQFCISAEE